MTENYISQDAATRKRTPMAMGLLDYFPAALAAVAEHSFIGNEKHNPGQPLHWSRQNSADHADCIVRHVVDRGTFETVYYNGQEFKVRHSAALAWRALALLQQELEDEGAAPGRGSRFPETSGHVNAMPLNLGGSQWELTPKAHGAIKGFNMLKPMVKKTKKKKPTKRKR